jgi:hypothetical protein
MRVAKKGRNLYVLLGDFKVNMNWGNEIIVSITEPEVKLKGFLEDVSFRI